MKTKTPEQWAKELADWAGVNNAKSVEWCAVQVKDIRTAALKEAADAADIYFQSMGTTQGMKIASLIKEDILALINKP